MLVWLTERSWICFSESDFFEITHTHPPPPLRSQMDTPFFRFAVHVLRYAIGVQKTRTTLSSNQK